MLHDKITDQLVWEDKRSIVKMLVRQIAVKYEPGADLLKPYVFIEYNFSKVVTRTDRDS